MPAYIAALRRLVLLTALYFAGAVVAVLFLRTPTDVTLFWPAAGVGLAATLRYGLRYIVIIPLATALLHLWVVPVPPVFVLWSIASNTLGTLLAGWYIQRRRRTLRLRTQDGLLLLRGGLLLSLASALIGSAGMVQSGMIPATSVAGAVVQWTLGDLLGVSCVTPLLLYMWSAERAGIVHGQTKRVELTSWVIALVVVAVGIGAVGMVGTQYPLALASVPLGLLLWSAVRLPPLVTLLATTIVIVVLSLVYGLGLGGFERPARLHDRALMMAMLALYSIIPVLVMASRQEHARAMSELQRRATRDTLTGLLNRDAFEEQARQALTSSKAALTLLYVDLDHFKLVNDSASHVAGDEMIRLVAGLLVDEFPEGALLARIAGDEFAVLAPLSESEAGTRARRLCAAIDRARMAWQGQNLGTTASVGLAMSNPPHAPFDDLLSRADAACFMAKELGGNRPFAATPNPEDIRRRARTMHSALAARQALDERRFVLFCQPIVSLREPLPLRSHFEILVQWRDTEGRLRPPAEIIAAAERYRIGPRLDRHVLDTTLAWLEAHPDAAAEVVQCGINIGGTTLVDEDFCDYVAARLRRSSVRAEQLCFEITETSVVKDMTRARRFISRLRDQGCRFALDDFGTGFCSFGYLRDIDVDYLKIDGSFVRNLEMGGGLSESVVRSITDIAHVLGKTAIAEQAETLDQIAHLRQLDVDYAQGYVFQRPQLIDDFFSEPGP